MPHVEPSPSRSVYYVYNNINNMVYLSTCKSAVRLCSDLFVSKRGLYKYSNPVSVLSNNLYERLAKGANSCEYRL